MAGTTKGNASVATISLAEMTAAHQSRKGTRGRTVSKENTLAVTNSPRASESGLTYMIVPLPKSAPESIRAAVHAAFGIPTTRKDGKLVGSPVYVEKSGSVGFAVVLPSALVKG